MSVPAQYDPNPEITEELVRSFGGGAVSLADRDGGKVGAIEKITIGPDAITVVTRNMWLRTPFGQFKLNPDPTIVLPLTLRFWLEEDGTLLVHGSEYFLTVLLRLPLPLNQNLLESWIGTKMNWEEGLRGIVQRTEISDADLTVDCKSMEIRDDDGNWSACEPRALSWPLSSITVWGLERERVFILYSNGKEIAFVMT